MHGISTNPDPKAFIQCFRFPQFEVNLSEHEADANGEPLRHRRSHGKSRNGCDKCKERRVKVCFLVLKSKLHKIKRVQCDERHPSCWNCTRLRLYCGFMKAVEDCKDLEPKPISFNTLSHPIRKLGKVQETPDILTPPLSNGIYPPLNMSHMHLFHHFSTVTCGTLVLGPQIWKEKIVPSAFKVPPHG
jgi:Fungal Zn(2)-Cys(6) binuclear cluster domain